MVAHPPAAQINDARRRNGAVTHKTIPDNLTMKMNHFPGIKVLSPTFLMHSIKMHKYPHLWNGGIWQRGLLPKDLQSTADRTLTRTQCSTLVGKSQGSSPYFFSWNCHWKERRIKSSPQFFLLGNSGPGKFTSRIGLQLMVLICLRRWRTLKTRRKKSTKYWNLDICISGHFPVALALRKIFRGSLFGSAYISIPWYLRTVGPILVYKWSRETLRVKVRSPSKFDTCQWWKFSDRFDVLPKGSEPDESMHPSPTWNDPSKNLHAVEEVGDVYFSRRFVNPKSRG